MLQSSQNCTSFKVLQVGMVLQEPQVGDGELYPGHGQGGATEEEGLHITSGEAGVPQQSGRVHKPSFLPGVQWPDRASSLYLPDKTLAWVTAFSTSLGEDTQDV